MTTPHPFAARLQSLSQLSDEGYVGPFRHDAKGAMVWCGEDGQTHALDVRGWGHLIGRRRMAEENAEAVYTAFGQKVALILTATPEVAALVEAAEYVVRDAERDPDTEYQMWVGEHLIDTIRAALDALRVVATQAKEAP